MILEQPYFMQNENWYYFDENDFRYKLTDKAPQKAQESYKEYYEELENGDKKC